MTVINTPDPSTGALYGAALVSTGLNLLLAWFLTQLVPRDGLTPIDGPAPAISEQASGNLQPHML